MNALGGEGIREAVSNYYAYVREPNHRYRSWEHCYRFFSQRADIDRDRACLHLGFYLASWGMLRGSTKLLQKDYKIHEEAVDIILSPQYDCLHGLPLENACILQSHLFSLISDLREAYRILLLTEIRGAISDTLITKVLLGTMGCIPAYDRFLVRGLRDAGLPYSGLKQRNFSKIIEYCNIHQDFFNLARSEVNQIAQKEEVNYPIMKVVDMYFWMRGANLAASNQSNSS